MHSPSQNVSFDESSMSSSMHSSKLGANNNSRLFIFAFSILNPYFAFPPSTIFFCCGFLDDFAFAAAGLFSFDDADFFFRALFCSCDLARSWLLVASAFVSGFLLGLDAFVLRAGAGFLLGLVAFRLRAGAGLPLCKGSSSESFLSSSLIDSTDVLMRGAGGLSLPGTGVSRLVGST
jgi:hypothetical protein